MKSINSLRKLLDKGTIYQVITGSTAYGLNIKSSDLDQKAIVILPLKKTFHLSKEWETETFHNPDIEYHSLKKVMHLLQSQNPTILETLFVEEKFIVKDSKHGQMLRKHRESFLTKTCYFTFGGYAKDQLIRIKNGLNKTTPDDLKNHLIFKLEQIIHNASERYPSLQNGNIRLKESKKDNKDINISLHFDQVPLTELNGITSELTNTIKSFRKNDTIKKKKTEKLHKHAMHLVRLLLTGIEVLKFGTLTVFQEQNRNLLLSIRNGKQSWNEIFELTDQLFLQLDEAYKNSNLPKKVNKDHMNQLFYEIITNFYNLT